MARCWMLTVAATVLVCPGCREAPAKRDPRQAQEHGEELISLTRKPWSPDAHLHLLQFLQDATSSSEKRADVIAGCIEACDPTWCGDLAYALCSVQAAGPNRGWTILVRNIERVRQDPAAGSYLYDLEGWRRMYLEEAEWIEFLRTSSAVTSRIRVADLMMAANYDSTAARDALRGLAEMLESGENRYYVMNGDTEVVSPIGDVSTRRCAARIRWYLGEGETRVRESLAKIRAKQ